MNPRAGCSYYFGETQYGKTTLALAHVAQDVRATGLPVLTVDNMPAKNFRHLPHERTVAQVLYQVIERRTHATWTPRGELEAGGKFMNKHKQFDALVRGLMAQEGRRPVIVLWDESSFQMGSEYISDDVSAFVRGWAHHECTIRATSQRPQDFHRVCWSCAPTAYVFHTRNEPDLDRLELEFQLDRDTLKALRVGQFIEARKGMR